MFFSCANQLPPSGGEDDKSPPEIISVSPEHGKLNFRGNAVIFKFNEYVDRRSFEESFYISPKPKGEMKFNWSGKEVEVVFQGNFEKNRTYVITIGKELKDVRGSNNTGSAYSIAFSTGSKLDKGRISGRIYSDMFDKVKILAYILKEGSAGNPDPSRIPADFIAQPDESGSFAFTNLPEGKFVLYAITDEDRNNLFDKDFESVSLLNNSVLLKSDTSVIQHADFLFRSPLPDRSGKEFLKELYADNSGNISSNISGNGIVIPADYRFYFYFRNNSYSKSEIVNNFSLSDSSKGIVYKPVFNWINDSLLEVFSTDKFSYSSELSLKIDLSGRKNNVYFSVKLKTADKNSSGTVSGKITGGITPEFPVFVFLINKDNKFISYSRKLTDTADFRFTDVFEGNYILFTFSDKNDNGTYDTGNIEPFADPEIFRFYEKEIKVKGNWTTDNLFITY